MWDSVCFGYCKALDKRPKKKGSHWFVPIVYPVLLMSPRTDSSGYMRANMHDAASLPPTRFSSGNFAQVQIISAFHLFSFCLRYHKTCLQKRLISHMTSQILCSIWTKHFLNLKKKKGFLIFKGFICLGACFFFARIKDFWKVINIAGC